MQVTETNADGLKREFKVVIDANEIDKKVQTRLKEAGKQARIPGFRPGKAPMGLLRQRFGQAVLGEVLEGAVKDSSEQAIQERGLRPAQQPKIEVESFDEGKDLEYKISMEVLPDVEPADFSQVELEKLTVTVPEAEVDEALERLASHHKESKALEEPRPAQKGDILVVDFKGSVDGEELEGMAGEDQELELGSNRFVEGFEDQLIGAEPGEDREVKVTFPSAYMNERLAGREAVFQVKVKDIREAEPVTLDDELAKKFGEDSLDELKDRVREQIRQDYEKVARNKVKRVLLDRLSELHDFDVPPTMVEQEFAQIWQQIEQDKHAGKLDPEDAGKSDEELRRDYQAIAERRVRLGLLLSEVGRRNALEVTQEELNRALIEELQRHPGQERQVFEFFQNNPNAMAQLRAPLYEEKAVDFILDQAKVTEREVTPQELRDELEKEADERSSTTENAESDAAETAGGDEGGVPEAASKK